MTVRHAAVSPANLVWATVTVAVLILATSACKSNPPKPTGLKLTLNATADVNPDASNRPSTVVVRVYQLKSDAGFSGADFFALYDDEQKVLAADLIAREEFVLAPGETKSAPLTVPAAAKFVGIIAAYRDVRSAEWRVLLPAPFKKKDIGVTVERARIVVH